MAWYSEAIKSVKGNNSGNFLNGNSKGVLHTTEGSTAPGAISAFVKNNSWPHWLVDFNGNVWQFIDSNKAARTLRNLSGGPETNREPVWQIEIVGFAARPELMTIRQKDSLRKLMRWIEATHGVLPVGPPLPFASHYGQSGTRMNAAMWKSYSGWCGHSHVPENDHWDPGMINLPSLLPSPIVEVSPMFNPPIVMPLIVAALKAPEGGVWLLGIHGEIYAFECQDKDAPNRHPEYWSPTQKAARLEPFGDGYVVIDSEGKRYAYP